MCGVRRAIVGIDSCMHGSNGSGRKPLPITIGLHTCPIFFLKQDLPMSPSTIFTENLDVVLLYLVSCGRSLKQDRGGLSQSDTTFCTARSKSFLVLRYF
jgi:hypothetical protein